MEMVTGKTQDAVTGDRQGFRFPVSAGEGYIRSDSHRRRNVY